MTGDNEQVHVSGTEARGGQKVGAMRYVLAISLVLVIVIFAIILMRPFG